MLTIGLRLTEVVMINEFINATSVNVRFRSRNRPPLSDFVRIIRKEWNL